MSNLGFAIDRPRDSLDTTRDSLEADTGVWRSRSDQDILDEEKEVEKLLRGPQSTTGKLQRFFGIGAIDDDTVAINEKEHRKYRREGRRSGRMSRRRMGRDEAVELMHDMEDGANRSSTDSSDASSEVDRGDPAKTRHARKSTKKSRLSRLTGIHLVILIAFAALLYGAYAASRATRRHPYTPLSLSNGTSLFAPTTLLISLDGFRADFLNRGLTPNLNALVRSGVSPPYMLPSFPSVTFPNHFTLVTGLYPESHSVVGNTFWDPSLREEFYYTDPERSMHPRFWLAEPLWTLAEKSGVPSAIHMWPGSEAHIGAKEPTYLDQFNAHEALGKKVNRVMGLLDLPGKGETGAEEDKPRPHLLAMYVPNVDVDGHKFGPNSTEIRKTITEVDNMIGDIVKGLEARNLTHIVNVVVVSDHGMATTSTDRLIQLDDIIDMAQIEHTDGWPLYGLRPKPDVDLQSLYAKLKAEAASSPGFEVYLRDLDMPARYHFSNNPRIAPLWIVPTAGWAIVTRDQFDVKAAQGSGRTYKPRGVHGYDHEHPLMRAIFIAHGPAFPHEGGSKVKPFQNVQVYGLVCDSLGLEPAPNNGTLRLPLTVDGKHENIGLGAEEEDLPAHPERPGGEGVGDLESMPTFGDGRTGDKTGWEHLGEMPKTGAPAAETGKVDDLETMPTFNGDGEGEVPGDMEDMPGAKEDKETVPAKGEDGKGQQKEEEDEMERKKTWWKWFKEKVEQVKDWASDRLGGKNGADADEKVPERPVIVKPEGPPGPEI
ncbi:alkaline-phosphatase-like protein [Elsinoe ampelina]|uniref:Alkaline-phosphatase-like protein n=1 Tax=Elsinoe ampelina TaxID=302913 RepID=A0A6A6GLV6_9PEZI|nr:alkaline-phosphatase-like protein [Elsinoe ampelina]